MPWSTRMIVVDREAHSVDGDEVTDTDGTVRQYDPSTAVQLFVPFGPESDRDPVSE